MIKVKGELNREIRHDFSDGKGYQEGGAEPDKSSDEADHYRFDEKLQKNGLAAGAEGLAKSDLLCTFLDADEGDVHDADGSDKERHAGYEDTCNSNAVFYGIKLAFEGPLFIDRKVFILVRPESS